ncbi:MAG: nicotinate-nucleotide adenylyltransferase [Acidobacteriota bacterium]|nr:nicotinate-nucleotide adenylyltransferase [Acidobacteriota bacterium]
MNIGIFGGTFDPIHLGHIALARTAHERFQLGRVLFVPAGVPPLRSQSSVASFFHRYAMVALATREEKAFVPSLMEAPETESVVAIKGAKREISGANYTVDTVRRLKGNLKSSDRLFFIVGIDAFKDISKWHEPEMLLKMCDFIVASRPGYSLADVANALPESLRPTPSVTRPFAKQSATGDLMLKGVSVHLLDGVNQNISATEIRKAIAEKRPLKKLLDPAVADYIKKMGLY